MEKGGSLLASLPPNYVTLASLKKRREEEEKLKQEEEQRKKEQEEEEEKARILKQEQEQERVRKLKEEEEEVTKLKEDETRFKKRFGRGRKPTLESATEDGSEISIKKTDDWREKRNERKKRWKQKKAERKANSQLQKDGSTVEVEKQSQSSPNPTVVVVVVVDESKETKPERADREVQVVDEGRRRRWRGGRKEWRKKEESSSSSTKDLTNPVAEIAPCVSVVGESNNEMKSSGSPPPRNWVFRSSSNWRRGRRFGNRVREDGNLMWVKKEQVTAVSTAADSSI